MVTSTKAKVNDTKKPLRSTPIKKGKGSTNFKAGDKFESKTSKPLPKKGFTNKDPKSKQQHGPTKSKDQTTNSGSTEKQDWAKFKQDKKVLKLKRKSSRDTYEITKEVKQLYEQLKCRRTENKDKLVQKMYKVLDIGNTIFKIAKAHDTARVLQCMLKYASPSLRAELSNKLLPYTVEMCQLKYSHFCLKRILKYGAPDTKSKLVESLFGHIVQLASHNIANSLLDDIYLRVATVQQRIYMRQEFYGDLYKKSKDSSVRKLEDTYKNADNMKASILGSVKANLDHIANKKLADSSLVHAVMLEYLEQCDDDKLEETLSAYAAWIPYMLTTKDGCDAAILCFYKSTPKNRRAIIKNIKEHLLKIATHEHGHVFLIALLNSLDDTKAAKKAIYDNLHTELKQLVSNMYGRRVIQWLVVPGDTSCFHPSFTKKMDAGLSYSKKDKELRRKEIFEQIETPIAEAIVADAPAWLANSHVGLFTADVINCLTTENYKNAVDALVKIITQLDWTVPASGTVDFAGGSKKNYDIEDIIEDATKQRKKLLTTETKDSSDEDTDSADELVESKDVKLPKKLKSMPQNKPETNSSQISGIECAGMHIVLKKIIKNDQKREEAASFGVHLMNQLTTDVLKHWLLVNRGCFILVKLVEQRSILLKSCCSILEENQLKKLLLTQKTAGAKLLAEKLNF